MSQVKDELERHLSYTDIEQALLEMELEVHQVKTREELDAHDE